VLRPVLAYYRDQRRSGERFGDFCHCPGVDRLRAQLGTERWARKPRDTARETLCEAVRALLVAVIVEQFVSCTCS